MCANNPIPTSVETFFFFFSSSNNISNTKNQNQNQNQKKKFFDIVIYSEENIFYLKVYIKFYNHFLNMSTNLIFPRMIALL